MKGYNYYDDDIIDGFLRLYRFDKSENAWVSLSHIGSREGDPEIFVVDGSLQILAFSIGSEIHVSFFSSIFEVYQNENGELCGK